MGSDYVAQNLLDAVTDQAIVRAEKHPGEFSNKELSDFMKVAQDQIMQSQKVIETLGEKPVMQITNQKNEVNIAIDSGLSRESKNKVIDIVRALVEQVSVDGSEEMLYNNSESELDDEEDE